MANHCREGEFIVYASRERLAAWAKLSTKTIHRLIYGYFDKRTGKRHKGLCERGILTELVKPRRFRNSAKYRINVAVLSVDPRVKPYLDRDRERTRQLTLPEIVKPTKTGISQQPVSDSSTAPQWTPCLVDLKALTDLKTLDLRGPIDSGELVWKEAKKILYQKEDKHRFETYLLPLKAAGVRDNALYLMLPTRDFADVPRRFGAMISEVVLGLAPSTVTRVEYLMPPGNAIA
jgi:hypothetical protein